MYDVGTRHVVAPVDDFIQSAAKMVVQIHDDPTSIGDVLVFMPGSSALLYPQLLRADGD